MDKYLNPNVTLTTRGRREDSTGCRFGVVRSHLHVVDSRDRDRTLADQLNANDFRLWFPSSYKSVSSIELMQAMIPIVPTGAGPSGDPSVVLRVDYITGGQTKRNYTIQGMSEQPDTNFLGHNNIYDDNVMAVIPLTSDITAAGNVFTNWGRDDAVHPFVHHFIPPMAELQGLRFRLFQRSNNSTSQLYGFAADAVYVPATDTVADPNENYQLMLEIVAGN